MAASGGRWRRPGLTSWRADRRRWRRRRLSSVVLVLLFGLAVCATGQLARASVASAAPTVTASCLSGFSDAYLTAYGITRCFNADGDFTGYETSDGEFISAATEATGTELNVPGSAVAAGVSDSATAAEAADMAEVSASAPGAINLGMTLTEAGAGGVAGVAITGLGGGFLLGKGLAQIACDQGIGVLCYPTSNPSYTPNVDIVLTDPGWVNKQPTVKASDGTVVTLALATNGAESTQRVGTYCAAGTTCGTFQIAVGKPTNGGATGSYLKFMIGSSCTASTTAGFPDALAWNYLGGNQYSLQWNGSAWVSPSTGVAPTWPSISSVTACTSASAVQADDYSTDLRATSSNGTVTPWTPTLVYRNPGDPKRAPEQDPNPPRVWEWRNDCSDGTAQTKTSDEFHETDATKPPFPTAPPCPAGAFITKITGYELTPSTGGRKIVYGPVTVPSPITDWETKYPECTDGHCRLSLWQVSQTDGSIVHCFTADGLPRDLCNGWFEDPTKTSDYICTYGPSDSLSDDHVDLSECDVYSPTFDPRMQAKGIPYGDPRNGAKPTGGPTAAPGPGTGGSGSPGGDPAPAPLPGGSGSSCWRFGWSDVFNPASWILKPFECALAWAFVPQPAALKQELSDTWDVVESRPPVSVLMPMVSFVQGFTTGLTSGCSGNIADFGHGLAIPCAPTGQTLTFVNTVKLVVEVLLFGFVAFSIWSMVEGSLKS